MANTSLTPRHSNHLQHEVRLADPFATPTLGPADLPALPEPAAHISEHNTSPHASSQLILPGGPASDRPAYAYKSNSLSSGETVSTMSPISSIHLDKSCEVSPPQEDRGTSKDRRGKSRRDRDPEKAAGSSREDSPRRRATPHQVAYLEEDEIEESRNIQENKAVKILLFLSGPIVILSLLNAVWSVVSLLITSLAQPLRLCTRRPAFGQSLGGLLGPSLNLQLKSIYTPLPPRADEDPSYRPGMLMLVQLLSPFCSFVVMLAAWVIWIYWISSAVVGDPAGTDKRDDGRETALMLRSWWERWLLKSMKEVDSE